MGVKALGVQGQFDRRVIDTPFLGALNLQDKHIMLVIMRTKPLRVSGCHIDIGLHPRRHHAFQGPTEPRQFRKTLLQARENHRRPIRKELIDPDRIDIARFICKIGGGNITARFGYIDLGGIEPHGRDDMVNISR